MMQEISHEHRSTISTKRERVERSKDHKESAKEEQAIGQSTLRKGTGRKEDQYPFLMRFGIQMADSAYECEMPQRP